MRHTDDIDDQPAVSPFVRGVVFGVGVAVVILASLSAAALWLIR